MLTKSIRLVFNNDKPMGSEIPLLIKNIQLAVDMLRFVDNYKVAVDNVAMTFKTSGVCGMCAALGESFWKSTFGESRLIYVAMARSACLL